jgi:hypothetical protein
VLKDFLDFLIGNQLIVSLIGQTREALCRVLNGRIPVMFNDPVAVTQAVADAKLELPIAVALTHNDIVDVIRRLLGELLVLWLCGLVAHHLVCREKRARNARLDEADGVGDIAGNEGRAARKCGHIAHDAFLVLQRLDAPRGQVCAIVVLGVGDLAIEKGR